MENYLSLPCHLLRPIAKLCVSSHPLSIETERYGIPPIPADERINYAVFVITEK